MNIAISIMIVQNIKVKLSLRPLNKVLMIDIKHIVNGISNTKKENLIKDYF